MVTVTIAVTKRWCGNESDAFIVTPKYRSKSKDIPLIQSKMRFVYTFTTREIYVRCSWKPLQRGWLDAMRPFFYTIIRRTSIRYFKGNQYKQQNVRSTIQYIALIIYIFTVKIEQRMNYILGEAKLETEHRI